MNDTTTQDATVTEADTTAQEPQNAPLDADQTEEAQTPTPPADGQQEPAQGAEDDREPRSTEAKRYRLRARAAEEQRDLLAAQVEALQRAEIERQVTATNTQPAAFWSHHGDDLAALLAEDGHVDPDAVAAVVKATREKFGIVTIQRGPRAAGVQGNTGRPVVGSHRPTTLEDAFRPRR